MVSSHSFTWMYLLSSLLLAVYGRPEYRDRIPNGYNVPNPCFPATIWNGVGHREKLGGGTLNPFGTDFNSNGWVWNEAICRADSDHDGWTNGYELGDENCAWTPANPTPLRQTDLSHPGICDPVGSPQCAAQNSWLKCTKDFVCPQVNDSDVRNITLRFPNTTVPLRETTYLCINFLLPNDTDYDIIATRPVVDNTIVVHHMVLAGCLGPVTVDNQPFDCMTYSGPCYKLIGLRNVGLPGNCLSDNYGYRIGPNGYQYAAIQIHYTNFGMKENLFDQSGMLIYYTPRLRPHRAAVTTFGPEYINIPPLQSVTVQSTCSSGCTSHLNHSLYIQSVFLHMHLLGVSGTIELYRGGSLFKMLDNESDYDYGNLNLIEFIDPVEMKPGDEIKVRCDYKSFYQNATTVFGESTYDEMCYGFIGYWDPVEKGFDQCEQYKTSEYCRLSPTQVTNCTLSSFDALYAKLPNVCDSTCNDTCLDLVKGMVNTGCVDCDTGEYLYLDFGYSKEKLDLIHRCRNQLNDTQPCPIVQKPPSKDTSAVQILKTSADLVLVFTMWIMANILSLLVN